MNFFSHCKTAEEAKEEYRKLAKKNHPDMGGSVRIMQEINRQYDALSFVKVEDESFARDREEWNRQWKYAESQDQYYRENTHFYGMPGSGYKYGSPGGYNQKYYEQRNNQNLYNRIAELERALEHARHANAHNYKIHAENEKLIKELKKKDQSLRDAEEKAYRAKKAQKETNIKNGFCYTFIVILLIRMWLS